MKLLAISDTHIAPRLGRRKDDVVDSVLSKWERVIGMSFDHKCTAIIHCGDIFDRPTVPRDIEQCLRGMIATGCAQHCFCVGTHDVGKGASDAIGKSAGSLWFSESVKSVADSTDGFWNSKDASIWLVSPRSPWPHGSDMFPPWNLRNDPVTHIIAAHKMIVAEPVIWDHLLVTDIQTDADIVISGDYHPGFDPVLHDGTWFCGVGALTRTFRNPHDLTRHPRCVLIDTDLLPENPFTLIPLPDNAVRPVEEVYDAESKSIEEHRDDLRDTVSDALTRAKQRDAANWDESIRMLLEDPVAFEETTGVSAAEGATRLRELCIQIEGGDKQDEEE